MKNILKTILFAFCLITIGSCEDDIDPKVSANGFALRTVDSPASLVLVPLDNANTAVDLEWDKSDNGGITTVSTYIIEVAKSGTNFANPILANGGNNVLTDRTYALKVSELNTIVNQLPGYQCGQAMAVDVRVKSTLGAGYYNAFVQYSNVVTLNVTPYSSLLPTLAFSATNAITTDTPKLASSGVINTDYEGYMWLTPGSYKFYKPTSCGDYTGATPFGDDDSGSFDTLVENGSGYTVLAAGFYLVKVEFSTLTYTVRPTTWNLFGPAKPLFPNANTPLTYNQTSKLWEGNINLNEGYEFKFRSNLNAFILGKYVAGTEATSAYGGPILSYAGGDLTVPGTKTIPGTTHNYRVTLDLNSPRNYSYTITRN